MSDQPTDATAGPDEEPGAPFLVCLGASAGGLEALEHFFAKMPADTGAAFVVIVHLSPEFKSLMPELLGRQTTMPVQTAGDETIPTPNTIYIIPPGKNMALREGRLRLESQDRGQHVLQLPIDIFLRSIPPAEAHQAVAIVLSGTGSDGSRGCRDLKEAGGTVLAQVPESAKFDGMPRTLIDTGVVDAQGTPGQLAEIAAKVIRDRGLLAEASDVDPAEDVLAVLDALRAQRKVDLGYLRTSMLRRRIQRRMTLAGIHSVGEYVETLLRDAEEARALTNDTMIGVTGFFRDPEAFRQLQTHLAAGLLRSRSEEQFRVWVPACATGEEVYSIGMLILETMHLNGIRRDVKIFATDVDDDSLAHAGRGTYPTSAVVDIGPARVSKFFTASPAGVAIRPELREMVVFAHHNLVKDPPFTRIDLISCRNLLIYLKPDAQELALRTLHFALKKSGLLLLGSAENLGRLESEFAVLDARARLFRKTGDAASGALLRQRAVSTEPGFDLSRNQARTARESAEASQRQLVEGLAALDERSIAVLSPEGAVLDIVADPLGVFRLALGRPTADVMRMLVETLTVAVATGLQRLRRGDRDVRYAVPEAEPDSQPLVAHLKLLAPTNATPERVLLVVERAQPAESPRIDLSSLDRDSADRLADLQQELMQTRETLHATIEELQSANEEQQSTNEELVASNEELQSTNEELQSVNEELFTVNVEYQNKHQELTVALADLDNLLTNINVGLVFLDQDLTIRKFTPAIAPVVRLVPQDIGRSIVDFAHSLGPDFLSDVETVMATGEMVERETRSLNGAWLLLRIRPYVVAPDQTRGVVATFFDVTALKNAHQLARAGSVRLASVNRELVDRRLELEEMFSIVAHDLKRPVVALDGLLWLVADEGTATPEAADFLARAQGECQRLREMLLDLEGIAGIQQRRMTVETVSLQPWLDELVGRFRPEANRRGVRLNCTSDTGRYQLATSFVAEILGNLMENALKYGSSGPEPRVDVSCRVIDGALELTVTDNGEGIAPENHQHVFEPFRRLNPSAAEGSGIGLLAVKRLLLRMGGSIALASTVGEGASFTARVPLAREPEEAKVAAPRRRRVLLVEDDDLDAKTVQRYLGNDYTITRAYHMAQAELHLNESHFDLVLLDLSLPDGHGLELVERIRELMGSVPIVVISGHGDGISADGLPGLIGGFVGKSDMTADHLLHEITTALAQHTARAEAGENPEEEGVGAHG
ncbi:MAG: chemotaxis protein CheB [Gemmatimonadales bacterium]